MNTLERDVELALSVLLALPIFVVWGFALFDIVRREDLPVLRKIVYSIIVVLLFPATLLYLLSRPTSIVRHHEHTRSDWRDDLLAQLEARPGDPPRVGPRQSEQLLERVQQLR